jgi:hypothetical protein
MATPTTASRPYIRQRASGPFWYGKWARGGKPVVRSLGRAWADPDGKGGWKLKRGRATGEALTEPQAASRMLELTAMHDAEESAIEQNVGAGAVGRPPIIEHGRRDRTQEVGGSSTSSSIA